MFHSKECEENRSSMFIKFTKDIMSEFLDYSLRGIAEFEDSSNLRTVFLLDEFFSNEQINCLLNGTSCRIDHTQTASLFDIHIENDDSIHIFVCIFYHILYTHAVYLKYYFCISESEIFFHLKCM